MARAYDEIIDFIAKGVTPADIVAFQPSEEVRQRVEDLLQRQKNDGLSSDESTELSRYLELEHIMRLAKARALGRCA